MCRFTRFVRWVCTTTGAFVPKVSCARAAKHATLVSLLWFSIGGAGKMRLQQLQIHDTSTFWIRGIDGWLQFATHAIPKVENGRKRLFQFDFRVFEQPVSANLPPFSFLFFLVPRCATRTTPKHPPKKLKTKGSSSSSSNNNSVRWDIG